MRCTVKRCSNTARTAARSICAQRCTAATASSMVSTMKPLLPSLMISGTEPARHATVGVPHDIASISTSPKGSGQSMETIAHARCRELALCVLGDFSTNSRAAGRAAARSATEVFPVHRVNLGRDPVSCRHGARFRWRGRRAFQAKCAREMQVAIPPFRLIGAHLPGQSVVYGASPVCVRQRASLIVRDRHHRRCRGAAANISG